MQFTGYHFSSDIILQAIRYYVAYKRWFYRKVYVKGTVANNLMGILDL
ncbi:hypothetical protein PDPJ_3_00189 [Photobacterium damselae subsp. piscicida]|nr:hypothetical protein PDPJ_3_00189 [Photobacterium damselae subsp. piscicida]